MGDAHKDTFVILVEQYSQERDAQRLVTRALQLTGLDSRFNFVINFATGTLASKRPTAKEIREAADHTWAHLRPDRRVLALGGGCATQMIRSKKQAKITEIRGMLHKDPETGLIWMPTVSPQQVMAMPDMFTDLMDDLGKLLTQDEPRPELQADDGTVEWSTETEPALAYAALEHDFDGASAISLDIETTGFNPRENVITGIGFGAALAPGESLVRIIRGEAMADEQVQDLMWHLTFAKRHVTVMHNGKFDLQFLYRFFGEKTLPTGSRIGDTMLLHHLLDERPLGPKYGSVHSLKTLARVYYDQPDYHWDFNEWFRKLEAGDDTPEDWDRFDWYHARDCHFTIQLWFDLREQAARESQGLLDRHDQLLGRASAALASMELLGAPVDLAAVKALDDEARARAEPIAKALEEHKAIRAQGLDNFGSSQQVGALLHSWQVPSAGPKQSMADVAGIDRAIAVLDARGETDRSDWLRLLKQWRKATKTSGTYTSSLLARARDAGDGDWRINASFWLAGSVTGRLSSSEPNLQNIPARTDDNVRSLFKARPGYVWMDCDYSQLELRVAASFSGDPGLRDIFKAGRDLHTEVAAMVFDKPADQVSPAERFIAKSVDFGLVYGQTAWALSEDEKIAEVLAKEGKRPLDQETAQQIMDAFMGRFPRLRDWLAAQERTARKLGYVDYGRRRRFMLQSRDKADAWSRRRMGAVDRQAKNSPIQGTASDINLDALCRVYEWAADTYPRVEVLFPVHDSICLHVPEDEAVKVANEVKHIMGTMPKWFNDNGVPYVAEAKIGSSWGDLAKDSTWAETARNHR